MGQPQPSVLVIDDEELIRSLLVESLSADGYEVEAAPSGEAAMERIKHRRFDLAITDLKMPGMDGIETLRALKEADREMQVAVMTGYASLETAVSALKGGACDYLEKPFKPTELAPILKNAMNQSALEGLLATYGASRVLIASMGHPDLCRMVVDLAEGVFHADAVGLILSGESGEHVVHRSGSAPLPADELLESLMSEAGRLGRPYCLPSNDEEVEAHLDRAGEPGAALVYPLDSGEGAFGAICLFRRAGSRSFTESDLQKGILFSSEVTRALTGARLKAELDEARSTAKRLRDQLEKAHRSALQGRLATTLARKLRVPVRRLNIGVHFLQDAFLDFQEVIAACRSRTDQLEAAGVNQSAFAEAEDKADIGYLLEQTPRAISEALDGATGIAGLTESIQLLAQPVGSMAEGVGLNSVLEAAIQTVRPEMEKIAVLEVETGDLAPVRCHPGSVGSALLAILMNAADAVHAVVGESGEKGRIGIRSSQDGRYAVVTIRDDGCGVRDHLKEKIFSRPGLGIAYVRQVIEEQHGGTVDFESASGSGTVFTVRLPRSGPSTD